MAPGAQPLSVTATAGAHLIRHPAERIVTVSPAPALEYRLPVTAKLSKRFYDVLGEDVANELVDWFNAVDLTYRTDLRELNELNFARFDAKMEQRLAEFDSVLALEVRQRMLELDSGLAAVTAADDAVRAATEAQRVVAERYRVGVISQTDALDANVDLLQAALGRTRAIAGVRLAEARLERALGR